MHIMFVLRRLIEIPLFVKVALIIRQRSTCIMSQKIHFSKMLKFSQFLNRIPNDTRDWLIPSWFQLILAVCERCELELLFVHRRKDGGAQRGARWRVRAKLCTPNRITVCPRRAFIVPLRRPRLKSRSTICTYL